MFGRTTYGLKGMLLLQSGLNEQVKAAFSLSGEIVKKAMIKGATANFEIEL
jgi:hypothetical protein